MTSSNCATGCTCSRLRYLGASFFFFCALPHRFLALCQLIAARVFFGFCLLLPVFLYRGLGSQLQEHWRIVFIISLANMSFFSFLAHASLSLNAGITLNFAVTALVFSPR